MSINEKSFLPVQIEHYKVLKAGGERTKFLLILSRNHSSPGMNLAYSLTHFCHVEAAAAAGGAAVHHGHHGDQGGDEQTRHLHRLKKVDSLFLQL